MKPIAKLISALVVASAAAFTLPAQAAWSSHLGQPWLGRNAVLLNRMSPMTISGREVIGMGGQRLGRVVGFNRIDGTVRIRTREGARMTVPEAGLRSFGGDLLALNMSRRDLRG